MNLLDKETILKANDLPIEEVYVPEWGGTVRVRTLTGRERDHFEASIAVPEGRRMKYNLSNVRARLVALSIVDENGKLLFSEADVKVLSEKSGKALDRIYSVACRLNGMSDRDMEDLLKNSGSGLSGGSGSG